MKFFFLLIFQLVLILNFHGFASVNDVKSKVQRILNNIPKNSQYGIVIYNPLSSDTIYSFNENLTLIPASNTKLFTTGVALALMGAEYKLSTKILAVNIQDKNGRMIGDLYIKGFGNSLFTEKDLDEMVVRLTRAGLNSIEGDIVGDDSFFDQAYSRFDWTEDEQTRVLLPAVSALVMDRNQMVTTVKKRKRYIRRYITVADPPQHIAEQLYKKLMHAGISVSGSSRKGIAPSNLFELASSSVPLKEVLSIINKRSDNFIAECLFKTVGAVASGKEGNAFSAAQSINKFIVENDIDTKGTKIVDGSGLSRYNQITVGSIMSLLEHIYLDIKLYDPFINTLSIAGIDGTLGGRMQGSSAEFNFRGKTGTLNGASSVSGYLKTKSGDDLIIAMIFEFKQGGMNFYRRIQDEIIELLAEYENILGN